MSDQVLDIKVESRPASECTLKEEVLVETNDDNNNTNGATDSVMSKAASAEGQGESEFDQLTLNLGDLSNTSAHEQMTRNKTGNVSPIMSDSSLSPVGTPRKLPTPHGGANSNSGLKGVLIKPKRILPAQPDSPKGKRTLAESGGPVYKTDDTINEGSQSVNGRKSEGGSGNDSGETVKKITLPKLQIDVDRLKLYFRKQGPSTSSNSPADASCSAKTQVEQGSTETSSTAITDRAADTADDKVTETRPQDVSILTSGQHLLPRDNALYQNPPDGVTKVKEWCSAKDSSGANMSEPCVVKSIERSIRSPSPRSNTTWDRSSSGYSSDERQDPRSPPPAQNATVDGCKKSTTTIDDGISMTTENAALDSCVTPTESDVSITDDNGESCNGAFTGDLIDFSDNGISTDTVGISDSSANANCDVLESVSKDVHCKSETFVQQTPKQLPDNILSARQSPRRPGWAMTLCNQPTSGRIQYRKSGSESLISLRHPSRQGFSDNNNFDGLEVCGKSYSKTPTPGAVRVETVASDNDKNDVTNRFETPTPTSAFAPVDKPEKTIINETGSEVPKVDIHIPDSPRRLPRSKFTPNMKYQLDIKSMGINALRDDKDIRKSLHELSSPRPSGKNVPIRARHSINLTTNTSNQPMGTFEAISGQPLNGGPTNSMRILTNCDRSGIKTFGKKMWRAPSGQPENAISRPFSPFGGTLPPSKIKEQESQRHHTNL